MQTPNDESWATDQRGLREIAKTASVGVEREVDRLHRLSWGRRLTEVGVFLALFGIGAAVEWFALTRTQGLTRIIGGAVGIGLMGLFYNSMALFIHEGLHGALARNRVVNRWLSFLCGVPILMSATAYRVTHIYHHFELGRWRDLGTYRQHTRRDWVVWLLLYAQLLAGSFIYLLGVPIYAWKFASSGVRRRILLECALIIALASAVALTTPGQVILLYWFLPMLVMNFLTNLRGLSSHGLGDTRDPLLASRSLKTSRLLSFLLLHENYHLTHHLFPKAPSYHMARLHALVWPRLPRAAYSSSYLGFVIDFVRASWRGDLSALGVVRPRSLAYSSAPSGSSVYSNHQIRPQCEPNGQ